MAWVASKSDTEEFFTDEWYVDAEGEAIAIVRGEANARRIAAVPEMLEALELVASIGYPVPVQLTKVYAAIAKAKGG